MPRTRKEMAAAQKLTAATSRAAQMRPAMRTGDDRYLPARDKGPVRRFIRDFVDSRFSFIELLIPLMLVVLILGWTRQHDQSRRTRNLAMLVGLRADHRRPGPAAVPAAAPARGTRFPDAPVKGTTYYAIARSMQMRFMRLPKAQVKVGQQLPERYR